MPTKNPRINITFDEEMAGMLSSLAQQEKKPLAHLARDLILEALELREDFLLSKIAQELDTDSSLTIPHDQAWK